MQFLLATLNVAYVLTKPYPEESKDKTLAAFRACFKFENDDFICRGHILNAMSDPLFDVYQNYSTASVLWIIETEFVNRLYYDNRVCGDGPMAIKKQNSTGTLCEGWEQAHTTKSPMMEPCLDAWYFTKSQDQVKVHHPNVTEVLRNSENTIPSYGINLDNVHLSECGSEAAFYEFKSLALKHSEKPR
ncbi:hypothetical protein Tco_1030877 [Tanacetum coccineum]|uniref:Uncharacterized protein n=1 Tax=Tanacetum coccineum TaxID=301880 RepID=A0ABQ5G8S1_9ASTR